MSNELLAAFDAFHVPSIEFKPVHREMVGGHLTSAILLSYLYERFLSHKTDTFFHKDVDTMRDTTLTPGELRRAKDDLERSGIILIKRGGPKGRVNYILDVEKLKSCFVKFTKQNPSCFVKFTKQPGSDIKCINKSLLQTANAGSATRKKKVTPEWAIRCAQQLATAYEGVRNLPKPNIQMWAKHIAMIHTTDRVEVPAIKRALRWYCLQLPDRCHTEGFLQIESGRTLREKFGRLQLAIRRESDGDETTVEADVGSRVIVREKLVADYTQIQMD